MMNYSNLTGYCSIAEAVLGARGFSYLLTLEIIVGSLAALANAPLMVLVLQISVFHFNLRLLLSQISLALLWYSLGYVVKAVYLLDAIVNRSPPCTLVMNAYECKRQEMPYTIPVSATMYLLLCVNLERLYSTLLYRTYDRTRIPWLGIFLVSAGWICPVSLNVLSVVRLTRNTFVGMCENLLSMNSRGAASALWLSASLLSAGVICCLIGYFWNNHKLRHSSSAINRAKHTLASRFQIDQNVKVNRIIMPSMLIVTLCYLPNYLFLMIVIAGLNLSYETRTWLIHINYLWKLIYALAHALISFKRNKYLRRTIGKAGQSWTSAKLTRMHVAPINEHDIHFSILEKAWKVNRRNDKRTSSDENNDRVPNQVLKVRQTRGAKDPESTTTKF